MSSFDKVIKLACKPKSAPPKSKYLDTIIAATWSEDGAVHDVCKALSPRFREPNSVVVFKALIVLHTMIRNGATDNVLGYLSSNEVLRLRNVSAGSWDGYSAPENLQNYAAYLDSRIRAYRDLKHDAVRVQAESNRDMRNSHSIEEDNHRSRRGGGAPPPPSSAGPARSKTIMGRKLRVMTVEKGLLRETRAVHRMIDALVECRFYLDDLEDELNITALRMLVKDLLILFQAGNEGVINVLEHYFEMSHVDATEALAIYRHFCKQTERVVEFLGVAKKLQNLLNVPIPNLKHAPVSLAGALQEYLEDPAFEQNRIEYKATKEAADKGDKKPSSTPKPTENVKSTTKPESSSALTSVPQPIPSNTASTSAPAGNKNIVDFFNAIEEEQPTMFNPQTNSPNTSYFQAQSAANPFTQMQTTGQPFMQTQQTGFFQPQHTAFPISQTNPFSISPQLQNMQAGHQPFSTFLPQSTGFAQAQGPGLNTLHLPQHTNLLQPQATGANPFRQSMMFPQTTGMALFGNAMNGAQTRGGSNTFSNPNQGSSPNVSQPATSTGVAFSSTAASPFAQSHQTNSNSQIFNLPTRPSSTPLTSFDPSTASLTSPPVAQPVKTHQTGTRNPFGPIAPAAPPPVPKAPTLMELSMSFGSSVNGAQAQQTSQPPQQAHYQEPPIAPSNTGFNSFDGGALSAGKTDMASVASSFAFNKPSATYTQTPSLSSFPPVGALNSQATSSTATGTTFSDTFSSSLSGQPTGMTSASSAPSIPPVKPQVTGFSGLKPFKPTSAFGASLLESLPSMPGTAAAATATTSLTSPTRTATVPNNSSLGMSGPGPTAHMINTTPNQSGFSSAPAFNGGSSLGTGLRPHMTGGGAANPFRASMMSPSAEIQGLNASLPPPPLPGLPSSSTMTFGSSLFSATSGSLNTTGSPFGRGQPQPQSSASLIQ